MATAKKTTTKKKTATKRKTTTKRGVIPPKKAGGKKASPKSNQSAGQSSKKRTRAKKVDYAKVVNKIYERKGILSAVADDLSITVPTIYNYAKENEEVKTAIEQSREIFEVAMLDRAEVALAKAVEKGQAWAIKYLLNKKGDKRGYKDKLELTGRDGGAIEVRRVDFGLD